jgi:hypothetical protein
VVLQVTGDAVDQLLQSIAFGIEALIEPLIMTAYERLNDYKIIIH